MTAGKRTESGSKPPRLSLLQRWKAMRSRLRPVTLTGWQLYLKLYLKSVYDKAAGREPVDVSYHAGLAAKEWKSMTDLQKANFEASVPPRARVHFEYATDQNEKAVRKMDLAEKMAGLRM